MRDDNAALQAGDHGALGIASNVVAVPRELGFGLVDAGLGLGRTVVAVTESVAGGTAVDDATRVFGPAWQAVTETAPSVDHWRLSVSKDANKVMVGTDRIGIQYKQKPGADTTVPVDQVMRLTHRWGDSEQLLRAEAMLEKNFNVVPRIPAKGSVAGLPVQGIEVVPGLRQNLTGSGAVTPSLNVDVLLPGNVKISLEMRQSGG